MAVFKCKMCGGDVEFAPGATVGTCNYCGTRQTLPKTSDDVVANLFNRANSLRMKCEFDKAEQIYEKIVQENDGEAEAHWGIVLCKYGIEYVEDPVTGKRMPTCHRTLFEAVTTDADYQAAIHQSFPLQQSLYQAEAQEIDRIQREILAIAKNEKPFDVFICYKEMDDAGQRTVDSALANDIYYQLTQEGLKVFYAAITLEDKLGQEYEPYIFSALNSAKVMLAVGTKPEYFNAVWVRNEWSRFLKLMKNDRSKMLIPCYRDMDAYDLPEEFAHLQAQDMSKIGFVNDLVRGIKKVVVPKAKTASPASVVPVMTASSATDGDVNVMPLLERAFLCLEDGNWKKADELCEQVLNHQPRNANAYFGKLMAEVHVKTPEGFKECAAPFDDNDNYKKLMRFGDEELKEYLAACAKYVKNRNETERLNRIYNEGMALMNGATGEGGFRAASAKFRSISGYKDAGEKAALCFAKAEGSRKELVYQAGKRYMAQKNGIGYFSAMKQFERIPGYKDATALAKTCKKKGKRLRKKEIAKRTQKKPSKRNGALFALLAAVTVIILLTVVVLWKMDVLPF